LGWAERKKEWVDGESPKRKQHQRRLIQNTLVEGKGTGRGSSHQTRRMFREAVKRGKRSNGSGRERAYLWWKKE